MKITSFSDMYLAELQELASAETQLNDALEKLSEAASDPELAKALAKHKEETKEHGERLQTILQKHDSTEEHVDESMRSLIAEAMKMMDLVSDPDLRDAALIASVQKLEHYEIAAYGTVAALAGQLDLRDDQELLHATLEEEKKTDGILTKLAEGSVNRDAAAS